MGPAAISSRSMSISTSQPTRVATARQRHLPFESELTAIEAGVKLEAGDLAEGGLARRRVAAGGGDGAGYAPDRQLAVELETTVLAEPKLR